MLVVFFIAAAAVLGGVFFAATGRGGEMALQYPDHAPLDLGPISAPDIALLRPPMALWGYNMRLMDEALEQISRAMRDRDVMIAYLQQQLASRDIRDPDIRDPDVTRPDLSQVPSAPRASQPLQAPKPPGILVAPLPHRNTQPTEAVPPAEASQPAEAVLPAQASQPTGAVAPAQAPQPAEAVAPAQASQPAEAVPPAQATQPTGAARAAEMRPASPQEMPGPQGSYDAHGWWAQQEEAARQEAARQEALRQVQMRAEAAAPPDGSGSPDVAGHPAGGPADQDDSRPGRTGTRPNPPVASPPNPPVASPPGTPDDDSLAAAEEQSW